MRQVVGLAILVTALAAISPAGAQPDRGGGSTEQSPGAMAAEGLEKILQALDRFIQSIPQYEPPVVTKDGDIIIRRKHNPERAPEPAPSPREAPPPAPGGRITI